MSATALIWIILFFSAALLFFVIAAVAGLRGALDLKRLLKGANRSGNPPAAE